MDQKTIDQLKGYDDQTLAQLRHAVNTEAESRIKRPTLDDIKPGMSAETEAAVYAEIRRVRGNG